MRFYLRRAFGNWVARKDAKSQRMRSNRCGLATLRATSAPLSTQDFFYFLFPDTVEMPFQLFFSRPPDASLTI